MTPSPIATDVSAAAPRTLRYLVGQPNVVATLEIAIRAFWNDHAAGRTRSGGSAYSFSGPPGTGKTLAARILAAELGLTNFKEALGQTFAAPMDLHRWLLDSDVSTALFIDECATMNAAIQHEMLIAIDENRVMLPAGPGRNNTRIVPLENPVFIFATTNPEDLLPALRSRMRVECHFDFYEVEALTLIVKQRADACHWRYESEDILREIAARSKQIPRQAMKLLTAVWRVTRSENAEVMTRAHLELALRLERIDSLGLDIWQRRYLHLLAEDGNRVEIRLGTISSTFGLPTKTISHVVEPYLLRQRLISKTEKGRSITERGLRHLRGERLEGSHIVEES